MTDPYEILGVSRDAAQPEIRKAYLRLAKKSHPDLHPGDKAAEARFKTIAAAYDIVGDEKKRARFDKGEIDASGVEQPKHQARKSYSEHADAGQAFKYDRSWGGAGLDESDLFAELFGRHGGSAGRRGADINYTIAVAFLEAVNGAKKRVVMADGKTLDITIPAGVQDGQVLRLRGQGHPSPSGGEPGDTFVEMHVNPHPVFHRDGYDIRSKLSITIGEALAGAKVPVETISGVVQLAIPKGSNTGKVLRLRGKGVHAKSIKGDHFVELQVILPDHPDAELVQAVVGWEAKHPYDPRKTAGAAS